MTPEIYFKRVITICMLFMLHTNLFAQTWTPKTNLPAGNGIKMSFSANGKGYVLLEYSTTLYEYNPATNTWTTKAVFPGTPRRTAVCFSIGNKGYVGTGATPSDVLLKDFWEYDATTNTWSQKTDFPGTAREVAIGFSTGGKGYLGTGYDGNLKSDFWEYDPGGNSWTQKTDFGGGVRGIAIGLSIGSKGYIGTGTSSLDNSGLTNDFWEYDPVINIWTQKSSIAAPVRVSTVGFSIGTKGYLGTGSGDVNGGGGPYYKDFWEYNPSNNTWTSKPNYPGLGSFNLIGFSIGTKAYVGGGEGGAFFSDFWEFNSSYTDAAEFDIAVQGLGTQSIVDFNNIDGSPTNGSFFGRVPFDGAFYLNEGITFSNSNNYNLYIAPVNVFPDNTSNSLSVFRFPFDPNFSGPAPYDDDDLDIHFTTPCIAAGFTIVDNGSSNPEESIKFFDVNGELIFQSPFPSSGSRQFIGFISVDRPIASIKVIEDPNDGDDIDFDDFIFIKANTVINGGQWIVKGSSPSQRRGEAAATENGIIYVVGGAPPNSTGSVATAEAYDPATNSWTTLPSMPIGSQQLVAQAINGIVYAVAGGDCCGAYSNVQAYDPGTNSWTLKTSAPTARYGATSAVVNNKMYVMSGGSGYGALYQTLELYDPVTNAWTTKAPMPYFRGGCAATAVNGIIYAIGGGDASGTFFGTVQAYDPLTDSWSIRSDMPTPRGGLTVVALNNKIYAIGGVNNISGDIGIIEMYDPATDTWSAGPPLTTLLTSLSSATVNGKIYAIGDIPPSYPASPVLTVEEFTPCINSSSSTIVTACDHYLWNGIDYTTSGDKTYTTTNAAGCDSVATLHLTINHSSTSSTTITSCDHYLWNGVDYITSGDKMYTTTNAVGCDSIATLHLTISHSSISSTTVAACDHYLWNGVDYNTSGDKTFTTTNAAGCDSVATIHLTIKNSSTSSTTITICDHYLWNGVDYTTSGDKAFTTTNAVGCDSIATLHLTIRHNSSSSTTVTACGQYLWNSTLYNTSGDKIYTTTNAAGCDSVATLHLTIINGPTSPSVTCTAGSPFTRNANGSCKYIIAGGEFNATASATCGIPVLSYQLTGATTGSGASTLSGIQLNMGTTIITWTATNGSLTSNCFVTINVIDNQGPIINCPASIVTSIKGKNCNTKVKTTNPTYSDNCGSVVALTWFMTGATSGTSPANGINNAGMQTFNAGVTRVIYTAKDAVGNTSTCAFTVTVTNPNCPGAPLTKTIQSNFKESEVLPNSDLMVKVNPNPSESYFTLTIRSGKHESVQISIMDISGRVVQKMEGTSTQSFIFGEKLINGIYMIEVKQGDQRVITKIIKQ